MLRFRSSIAPAARLSLAAVLSVTAVLAGCSDDPTLPTSPTLHFTPSGPSLSATVGNVSADPASIKFPGTLWHMSTQDTVTLTNSGTDTVAIKDITISGANTIDFNWFFPNSSPPDCFGKLAPGAKCLIGVQYTAQDIGPVWASLDITLPAGILSVGLTGEGIHPALLYGPDSISFANQTVGTTSAAQTFMIKNIGTADMYVGSITLQGTNPGDFVVVPPSTNACAKGVPIAPNTSCDVGVAFAPTATGSRTAALVVKTVNINGYSSGDANVDLYGTGTQIISDPADLAVSFGAVPNQIQVGKTITYAITVKNAGPGAASAINLTAAVPVGTGFAGLSTPNGVACSAPATGDTGGVFCSTSSMASGSAFTVQLYVKTLSGNRTVVSNSAKVTSTSTDPVSGNNSATVTTTVIGKK